VADGDGGIVHINCKLLDNALMSKKDINDGHKLESLVAFVEKINLPDGFAVEVNKKILGDDGVIEAELDILISGMIGSSKFHWLIECRDRPSSGNAPASWIEQLIGRRDRMQFNKVTAASTQPFSRPAIDLAREKGIDLRNVSSLTKEEFQDWLFLPSYKFVNNVAKLIGMNLILPMDISNELNNAVQSELGKFDGNDPILIRSSDGERVLPKDAFLGIVELNGLFSKIQPNGEPRTVNLIANYINDGDCFLFESSLGMVRIQGIDFTGELSVVESDVLLKDVFEYSNVDSNLSLSQTAMFEEQFIGDAKFSLTVHKDLQTEEIKISIVPSDITSTPSG
jgi:Restriction endonuclease